MKSAFGSKLFRLFLLFSIVPSILIALFGYYLTSETTDLLATGKTGYPEQIRLLHERLDAILDTAITLTARGNEIDIGGADFMVILSSRYGGLKYVGRGDESSMKLPFVVGYSHIRDNEAGIAQDDSLVIQYVARTFGNEYFLAGFVYDSDYRQLLLQSETAATGPTRDIRAYYTVFVGMLLLFVLALTGLAAWFFSRRMSSGLARPIAELDSAAGRIANGQFGEKISVEVEGELATLVESFNRMSARLEQTTVRLAQTERVAAWRSVARRFAHEIKNPLQPILISLHRIQKITAESDLNERLSDPLRAASEEVSHLQHLADRFSQLAKLPDPKPVRCDLAELTNSVAELYRDQMTDRDYRIIRSESPLPVELDETYFREVIHNLLRNAIDATQRGDLIEIATSLEDSGARLSVRDGGAGMSPETIDSARLPYFSTKEQGNGLGLAIVEKIVTEAGGTLTIQSKPTKGTRVMINLPLAGDAND